MDDAHDDDDHMTRAERAVARVELERATKEIRATAQSVRAGQWKIGRKLAHVAELRLYRAKRFADLGEYVEKELDLQKSQAYVWARTAAVFARDVFMAVGPSRLDAGLAHIARTPEDESPEDLTKLVVRIPRDDGRGHIEKPFLRSTVAEVKAATRALSSAETERASRVPAEVLRLVAAAESALDAAVGESAAERAEVSVHATEEGDVVIDVRGVPLSRAPKALAAVARALREARRKAIPDVRKRVSPGRSSKKSAKSTDNAKRQRVSGPVRTRR